MNTFTDSREIIWELIWSPVLQVHMANIVILHFKASVQIPRITFSDPLMMAQTHDPEEVEEEASRD